MPRKCPVERRICDLQFQDVSTRTPRLRYNRAKREARRRGYDFDIPYSFYTVHVQKPCHYCGFTKQESSGWMDRIDNSKGYLKSNVLPCCATCNNMRGTLPVELFFSAVRKVFRNNRGR